MDVTNCQGCGGSVNKELSGVDGSSVGVRIYNEKDAEGSSIIVYKPADLPNGCYGDVDPEVVRRRCEAAKILFNRPTSVGE